MRTKDDIVKAQVTDLFKARDFQDVIIRAYKVKGKLESLGCFRNIGVYIDTSQGPQATPDGVEVGLYNYTLIRRNINNYSGLILFSSLMRDWFRDSQAFLREALNYILSQVTFTVREMRRLIGGINTMVGNNDGSVIIGAKAPNLFGRGERLQMEYSHSTKSSTNINVSAIKPFVDSWLHTVYVKLLPLLYLTFLLLTAPCFFRRLTSSVFNTSSDFPWSGYNQRDKGLLIDIALNPDGVGILRHNLQYEATFRKIVTTKQASFRVREQCGPSLKSALRHICSIDKRDSVIFPTAGSLVQFSTEVAGLGGNIGFVKNELTMQTNWTPHECLASIIQLRNHNRSFNYNYNLYYYKDFIRPSSWVFNLGCFEKLATI